MTDFARKCLDKWVLTVNGSLEQHQKMIRATLAKRAYELFELRGRPAAPPERPREEGRSD